MQFKPTGGFPPIIRLTNTKTNDKTLESRGFSNGDIVSIGNIMNSKKKENLFLAFGSNEEEEGIVYNSALEFDPYNYDDIQTQL